MLRFARNDNKKGSKPGFGITAQSGVTDEGLNHSSLFVFAYLNY
ncbi:hypothetical protein OSCI_3580007 [Kamptonema sp. PCC 6506]|nr:hypothetical protein OSCI_3580007 [Kamptonema sp. PCC 6506]